MYEDRVVAGGGSRHVTAGLCEGSKTMPLPKSFTREIHDYSLPVVLIIKDRDLDFLV